MNFLYKVPGYLLLLFGGFCLSWGGLIIRQFQEAGIWEILLLRSFFFLIAILIFLFSTYKKDTLKIIRDAGFPAVIGGFFLSLSFVAYTFAITSTTVANVVFILASMPIFSALFSRLFLNERFQMRTLVTTLFVLLGLSFIAFGSTTLEIASWKGDIWALYVSIAYAAALTAVRKLKAFSMIPAIPIAYIGAAAVIYIFLIWTPILFVCAYVLEFIIDRPSKEFAGEFDR